MLPNLGRVQPPQLTLFCLSSLSSLFWNVFTLCSLCSLSALYWIQDFLCFAADALLTMFWNVHPSGAGHPRNSDVASDIAEIVRRNSVASEI